MPVLGQALGLGPGFAKEHNHSVSCMSHHPVHTCNQVTCGALSGKASKEVVCGRILKVALDFARWSRKEGPHR